MASNRRLLAHPAAQFRFPSAEFFTHRSRGDKLFFTQQYSRINILLVLAGIRCCVVASRRTRPLLRFKPSRNIPHDTQIHPEAALAWPSPHTMSSDDKSASQPPQAEGSSRAAGSPGPAQGMWDLFAVCPALLPLRATIPRFLGSALRSPSLIVVPDSALFRTATVRPIRGPIIPKVISVFLIVLLTNS